MQDCSVPRMARLQSAHVIFKYSHGYIDPGSCGRQVVFAEIFSIHQKSVPICTQRASGDRLKAMPVLKKPQMEKFAVLISGGLSPSKAYVSAGYSEKGAATSAAKLLQKPEISSRIAELCIAVEQRTIEGAAVTRSWVLEQLKRNAKLGSQLNEKGKPSATYNLAASNQALRMLGVELGMFRENVDHTMRWDGDLGKLSERELTTLIMSIEAKLAAEAEAEKQRGLPAPVTIEASSEVIE